MALPFSREQFLAVFADYNAATYPAVWLAYLLCLLALGAVMLRWSRRTAIVAAVFALLWLWTGIVYHELFFSPINPAARVFAAGFVLQAALFGLAAIGRMRWTLEFRMDAQGLLGLLLITYAAILYPLAGVLAGHSLGEVPPFGITPCPLTLFTFGMLLLSRPPHPWALTVIPVLWSLIGGTAAFLLDVPQDWPLLFSGVIVAVILLINRSPQPASNIGS